MNTTDNIMVNASLWNGQKEKEAEECKHMIMMSATAVAGLVISLVPVQRGGVVVEAAVVAA